MSPWGNDHPAEGISARVPLGKLALAQQQFHWGQVENSSFHSYLYWMGSRGNTSFSTSKNRKIFPQMLWKWKHKGENSDPREMKSRGKAYLQTLFPIPVSAWINSFNKGHIHEHGTEKNMCYILTVEMWVWESIFLPVYLKEKSLHSNFINCKGKRKEK